MFNVYLPIAKTYGYTDLYARIPTTSRLSRKSCLAFVAYVRYRRDLDRAILIAVAATTSISIVVEIEVVAATAIKIARSRSRRVVYRVGS